MMDMPMSANARRIRRVALGDLLHRSARKWGDRTAVVDGDLRLNYVQLDALSSQCAHYLLNTLGSVHAIGMLCANSADMLVATNGVHKSANLWVPVNTKLDVATIDYVLRHAKVV